MQRHSFFRVTAFVLPLALLWGILLQGSQVGPIAEEITAAASIDMPLPMNCQSCCDRADACFDACHAVSVCGLAIVPVNPVLSAFGAATFDALPRAARADRTSAPDPHPPKRLLQT